MRVFLIAGEPSGDRLGGALMAGLKRLHPDIEFAGVGAEAMEAQGLNSLFDMRELSIMGLAEILPKYRALKARIRQTADAVLEMQPDVLITIDAPDFNLRVARRVKAHRPIRTVHYVAPSVWAWRPGRAVKMARVIDHVLALLPFEPPYMTRAGMACDFVGHPVVAEPVATKSEIAAFRDRLGVGQGRLITVLPGSRRAEVARLAPVFGRAIGLLAEREPALKVVVPAAPSVADAVHEAVRDWPVEVQVLDPRHMPPQEGAAQKRAAFGAADAALAASGTVSLELAAAGTPMVIAYDMNRLSLRIMTWMMRIDTVTLVNLVTGTRAVPEFIGPACTPDRIAAGLRAVLEAPEDQRAAMQQTMDLLGRGGEEPGLRAARAVLERIAQSGGASGGDI
jgi:lipid-A-disaccharide synthase